MEAFQAYDRNGSKMIEQEELRLVLEGEGAKGICKFDRNGGKSLQGGFGQDDQPGGPDGQRRDR